VSWFSKLRASLTRSRDSLSAVETLAVQKRPLDDTFYDELEEILITADFGFPTAEKILDGLKSVGAAEGWETTDQAVKRFKVDVQRFLTLPDAELRLTGGKRPIVILVVGVNGSGKTTTIGKLAARLSRERKRVMVVAGDTFRAAAAEQLEVWAQRAKVEFVRGREGADPSSVIFDGITAAKARGTDVVLIDTAGRLQTKSNLMDELKKMRRIIERELGEAPAETLLVVDGTTGQNAISQARLFNESTKLTGVVVTKLDSTAKGGVLVAIVDTLEIPIKFIGIGEKIDELQPFDPKEFTDALFNAT
jgi:fused signal recognition particle receptor